MPENQTASELVKQYALNLGFFACGIAKAASLDEQRPRLEEWLESGCHAGMDYMARNLEKRLDPRLLAPEVKTIVVVLQNYHPPNPLPVGSPYLVSGYAYGKDYHKIIKNKLRKLLQYINQTITPAHGRVFADSVPMLERTWAVKAGLGWLGKNTMLITPRHGSYFFIGELFLDIEFEYDQAYSASHCGSCRKCVDACPTGAIRNDGMLDARRCISYLTIEHREFIPEEFKGVYQQWIFGCDICQQVCPWNRFSVPHHEPGLTMIPELARMSKEGWENISEEDFNRIFAGSPIRRTGYRGLKRNISFLEQKIPEV